jgi:glutaconate CoA-transferase subunit A
MIPKVETLAQACGRIEDGMTLALGGMTLYRRPVAFVLGLLQRSTRPQDLTLLNFTAGYESDLLVGAGCVKVVRSVYFGLEAFGLAPMFTQLAGQGVLHVMDETESSIVSGLRASMAGVGFMPSTAWQGTDLLTLRPDVKTIQDPYTGEILTAFPAIDLDVVVIHGIEADQEGNVRINQNLGIDLELMYVAKTVICTVERMTDALHKTADSVIIPSVGVDVIVMTPNGAFPTSCHPLYAVDGLEIMRYVEMCNQGAFEAYLEQALMNL